MVRFSNRKTNQYQSKHNARLFTFVAAKKEAVKIGELDLPEDTQFVFFYRDEQFNFIDGETRFQKGDEIVVLTHSRNLSELKKRWPPKRDDSDN